MDLDILRRSPLFATLDDAAFKLLTDDIQEIDLMSYEYEQDATNRTWFVSSLKYQIKYED